MALAPKDIQFVMIWPFATALTDGGLIVATLKLWP